MTRIIVSESTFTVKAAVKDADPVSTRPGYHLNLEVLPTSLSITYTWGEEEWRSSWTLRGRVRKDSKWSDETADLFCGELAEVPEWIDEAVDEFRPQTDPQRLADSLDLDSRCRVCGCTENRRCEGGCEWMDDPLGGDICSTHFIPARDLEAGIRARATTWADGEPVRILNVTETPDGQVSIHYQDACAYYVSTLVHVDPTFPVLVEGADE